MGKTTFCSYMMCKCIFTIATQQKRKMDHEEEYVFDEDAENDDHGAEDVDPIENAYYNAKGDVESKPHNAIKGFAEVLQLDVGRTKWSFKAYKQMVRANLKLKNYAEAVKKYDELLSLQWTGKGRNDVEKVIHKLIEGATSAGGGCVGIDV